MPDLAQEAIEAALSSNWENAILLNSKIIKKNSKDIDALNRIARAYAEKGDLEKARIATQKALKIDPTNPIANRCVLKWKNYKPGINNTYSKTTASVFIEEPTRTKIVSLINLGESANITSLDCGDMLKLIPQIHRVNVATMDDKYVGRFPDNLAAKFISLIKLGGTYEVLVKSVSTEEVKIFVRSIS